MACRVFRDMKLRKTAPDNYTSGTEHHSPSSGVSAHPLQTFRLTESRRPREPVVEITKTVEQFDDRDSVHAVMQDTDKGGPFPRSEDEFV